MEDKQFPVFHYTSLENLPGIIKKGLLPRKSLMSFTDIAIESCKDKRQEEGLLGHVPCYVGFHCWFPSDELRQFFWDNDYYWRFQNHTFFGSLNNVIRRKSVSKYERVIILMFKETAIRQLVRAKRIRLYSDLAIRSSRKELHYEDEDEFFDGLASYVHEKENGQLETNCELDILHDTKLPLKVPDSFECIIVDNDKIRKKVEEILEEIELEAIVSQLPRGRFV